MATDGTESEVPLARLLAMALRLLIDQLHQELGEAGHPVRPAHGYALVAVGEDGTTASRLAAVLGITKQGTAKLVANLVELGYVAREPHAEDGRARLLVLTGRGRSLLQESAAIQGRIEQEWARLVGDHGVHILRRSLERIVSEAHVGMFPPVRPVW